MTPNQTVSIIMPAYNAETTIAEAINSVLNQTYSNWELVITDDGSTDETGGIIDAYAAKDRRIKAFHTKNKGVSRARNIGLENASGMWVAFLDSDDKFPPEALELLVSNSEGCDLVIGNHTRFPHDRSRFLIKEYHTYNHIQEMEPDFTDLFWGGFFYGVWGKLIRKELIQKPFCENYQLGEDTLFFSNIVVHLKKIRLIPYSIYLYRTGNTNSLSHQNSITLIEINEVVCSAYSQLFCNPDITFQLQVYYLHTMIFTLDAYIKNPDISIEEKRLNIAPLLRKDFLKGIPLTRFPISSKKQRKATLILMGDLDLIIEEFGK